MNAMNDLYDIPQPYPEATLLLPDGAGEVRVRVKQAWKFDLFATHFVVEVPAWDRWTQTLGGEQTHGLAPSIITMWVPHESVRFVGDDDIKTVKDAITSALEAQATA
ncbi:hypothetical protein ACFVTY_01995 [Streptomyces sp. NPDC058067]|uniref:hypothetical protein n=1 Tax=Streptomyces sp. NPDC058067 TaxID=3346324 RepID=UPI0036E99647